MLSCPLTPNSLQALEKLKETSQLKGPEHSACFAQASGWGCSLIDKTAFTKFCRAVKYKLNCCDIPNKPNYPSRPCKWWLEFSKGLAGGTAPLPLVQGMHCEPCGAGGGLGAFPLHCTSETVSLLPALLCRSNGLSCNLPATTAKAGSKGGGEESSVQSHLGRTMGHKPSMPPSDALVTCPFHGPCPCLCSVQAVLPGRNAPQGW